MTDEAGFLAAIASAPEDDSLRLVFADWLEENGRAGGAFLRTELALVAEPLGTPCWHAALARYRVAAGEVDDDLRTTAGRHSADHWLAAEARSAWTRLERGFAELEWDLDLAAGASPERIEAVEQAIGRPLPPDVRESFAIHDGCEDQILLGDDLLTTQQVIGEWEGWRGLEEHNEEFRWNMESFPAEAIALDYANPGWIPLATRPGVSDLLGVDLAPGPAGSVGQVINFGRDEHNKCVIASGWGEFLADLATLLESKPVLPGLDPEQWYAAAINQTHPHDWLCERRKEGHWPLDTTP